MYPTTREFRISSVLALAITVAGCAAAPDEAPAELGACADVACLEAYEPAADGKADGAGNDLNDAVRIRLMLAHGVRPRRYNGFFNASNWGEERFRAALPQVTRFVNEALARRGVAPPLTEAEVATNFITEGGYFALDLEGLRASSEAAEPGSGASIPTWDEIRASGNEPAFDGFTFFGVDTLVDNFEAVRAFMPEDIRALVDSGQCVAARTNEQGRTVHSLDCLTLEQGMYANAGMFAWFHEQAARALAANGADVASLPAEARFFWTTVFFNSGAGTGTRTLREHGADYYLEPWTHTDDAARWGTNVKFNATWRMASLLFMRDTVFVPLDLPGESVCRWSDSVELGDSRDEATLLGGIVDAGDGRLLGYLPGNDRDDWVRIEVQESSRESGMCALVRLSRLPADYSLCVSYVRNDGEDPVAECSRSTGTADEVVQLDLDRFGLDDSGALQIWVSRNDAPAAVCDGYELSWSIGVGPCAR